MGTPPRRLVLRKAGPALSLPDRARGIGMPGIGAVIPGIDMDIPGIGMVMSAARVLALGIARVSTMTTHATLIAAMHGQGPRGRRRRSRGSAAALGFETPVTALTGRRCSPARS
jgi:hypothetical protein